MLRTTENASDFTKHGPNPFRAFGHFDVEKFLYGKGVAELVGHCGESIKSWRQRHKYERHELMET